MMSYFSKPKEWGKYWCIGHGAVGQKQNDKSSTLYIDFRLTYMDSENNLSYFDDDFDLSFYVIHKKLVVHGNPV